MFELMRLARNPDADPDALDKECRRLDNILIRRVMETTKELMWYGIKPADVLHYPLRTINTMLQISRDLQKQSMKSGGLAGLMETIGPFAGLLSGLLNSGKK